MFQTKVVEKVMFNNFFPTILPLVR